MKAWNRRKRAKHWTKPKWVVKKFFSKKFYVLKSVYTREKIVFLDVFIKSKILNINFEKNQELSNFIKIGRKRCKSK